MDLTTRSRAVLLPHPADPFLFLYWLRFFTEVWGEEVDKLYILINSPIEGPVIDYMLRQVAGHPKIDVTYVDHQMEHGAGIDLLLEKCQEEYVMLIEDDGYIFKKGVVDANFRLLEEGQYDVIGSPRGSCSNEISNRAKELWGLNYEGMGDVGCNFWPNFFFTRKECLLATDRNFNARAWSKGEMILPLGIYVEEEIANGDTFVNTSLQLRAKGYRIKEIPQYHRSPDDQDHAQRGIFLFDGIAPWIHVGSLSSGVHGILIDDYGRPLARRLIDPPKETARLGDYCHTDQERLEWESRVTFWQLFLENYEKDLVIDPLPEFHSEYQKAIQRVINQYELPESRIEKRKLLYKGLGL